MTSGDSKAVQSESPAQSVQTEAKKNQRLTGCKESTRLSDAITKGNIPATLRRNAPKREKKGLRNDSAVTNKESCHSPS